ncbi:MAG: hypothetical protein SF029_10685 [bacterium]|nr:hypothetical protein [bacterium]
MPREELPPDPDELEKWHSLPQNKPSRQAMPPIGGGTRWVWWLFGGLALLILLGLLVQVITQLL